MLGEHALLEELDDSKAAEPFKTPHKKRKLRVPFDAPTCALNSWSAKALNALYYWNGTRKAQEALVDWDTYFYPLDALLEWNRIYGRRGFAQFQCVLPLDASKEGLSRLLQAISASGLGSFLAVLKRFGKQESRFSFPMEGYTLALDFPVNRTSLALLNKLDETTIDHGGRFYLAKDARMSAETLENADQRVAAFRSMREKTEAGYRFASMQSERLGI
jgi:hypothetical protein